MRPRWAWGVLRAPSRSFGNLDGRIAATGSLTSLAQWIGKQFDPTLCWRDLEWIRDLWPGNLILKGVMCREDAALACKAGVDALVVSNHGGRQLDGARASIHALADIADEVAGRLEILFDGGVTSGQAGLKSLPLGAPRCVIRK